MRHVPVTEETPPGTTVRLVAGHTPSGLPQGSLAELVRLVRHDRYSVAEIRIGHDHTIELPASLLEVVS